MLISIDSESFASKPSNSKQYKDQKTKFGAPRSEISVLGARLGSETQDLNVDQLGQAIESGRTWSPYTFNVCPLWNRPRRLEGLFKSCEVFALDFDKNEDPQQIIKECKSKNLPPTLVHYSFSSTPEFKKFRVIFNSEEVFTDFLEVKRISLALSLTFNSDPSCVDAARLFFGSIPGSVIYKSLEKTSGDSLRNLSKNTKVEQIIKEKRTPLAKPDETIWGNEQIQKELFSKLGRNKLKYVKGKIRNNYHAVKSLNETHGISRYDCVWKNTSGLARMPEITGKLAYEVIIEAIEKNDFFSTWDYDPQEVIMSAIKWSASHAEKPV